MNSSTPLNLAFGDRSWEIPCSDNVQCFLESKLEPVADLEQEVYAAFESPIGFPCLDQVLVSGDSLVFAVDPIIPNLSGVMVATLKWFQEHGCSLENIRIVIAENSEQRVNELRAAIESGLGNCPAIEAHDPDDEEKVAYVAANQDSEPIYMNRTLVDADVVIPMTCARSTNSLDFFGAYGLYPLLSNRATRGSFYRFLDLVQPRSHSQLTDWANQAATWAGFLVAIQVIPANANEVGAIHAGLLEPLEKECERAMDDAWCTEVQGSNLTVALLEGGPAQQNWLGLARSLHCANRCTDDGGAIVLCTQLHETLGKAMGRLRRDHKTDESLARKLSKDSSDDAIAASMIHSLAQHKHLYLVSGMRGDTVESLGLGVVREQRELLHLIEQFSRVTILGSAQHRNIRLIA